MSWDKRWLDGKVYTTGLKEAAEKYIPEMRAKGADLVVAISHGGLDNSAYSPTMENGSWWLSKVTGIDAMLIGHHRCSRTRTAPCVQPAGRRQGQGHRTACRPCQLLEAPRHARPDESVDMSQTTVETADQNADKLRRGRSVRIRRDRRRAPGDDRLREDADRLDRLPDELVLRRCRRSRRDPDRQRGAGRLREDRAGEPATRRCRCCRSARRSRAASAAAHYTDVAPAHSRSTTRPTCTCTEHRVRGEGERHRREELARNGREALQPDRPDQRRPCSRSSARSRGFDMFTSADLAYEIDVTQPVGSRIKNLTYKGAAIDPNAQFIVATNNYRERRRQLPRPRRQRARTSPLTKSTSRNETRDATDPDDAAGRNRPRRRRAPAARETPAGRAARGGDLFGGRRRGSRPAAPAAPSAAQLDEWQAMVTQATEPRSRSCARWRAAARATRRRRSASRSSTRANRLARRGARLAGNGRGGRRKADAPAAGVRSSRSARRCCSAAATCRRTTRAPTLLGEAPRRATRPPRITSG